MSRPYDPAEMRENLSRLDTTQAGLADAIRNFVQRTEGTSTEDVWRTMESTLIDSFHSYAARIDAAADSVIERVLFNSMLVGCAVGSPFELTVMPADDNAPATIERRLREAQSVWHVRKLMKESPGKGGVKEYTEWLEKTGKIDHEEAEFWRSHDIGVALYGDSMHMIPQAGLPGAGPSGKNIRVDALVWCPSRPKFRVVVECDGYQWHGDKDAFTNDRQRDRALREAGYEVLRFSGSEINRDPVEAGMDLYKRLLALKSRARVNRRYTPTDGPTP